MTDSGQWVWGSHLNSLVKYWAWQASICHSGVGESSCRNIVGAHWQASQAKWMSSNFRERFCLKKNKVENAQERYIMMVFGFCIMCTHAWIYTKTYIQCARVCAHSYKLLYKSTPSWQFFSCCISFSQTLSRTSLRVQTPPLVAHDICMDLTLHNDVSRGESVLPWYPEEAVEGTCDEQLDWDIILNWALTLD